MGKMIKMAWWSIARGRLDRDAQEKFERAQLLATERGVPVQISITVTVKPPRPKEPEYQAVIYTTAISEPKTKSKEYDLVIKGGVAVSDAENHPDQEHLELSVDETTGELKTQRKAVPVEN